MFLDVHAHYDEKDTPFGNHFVMPRMDVGAFKTTMAQQNIRATIFFAGLSDILEAPKTSTGLWEANERLSRLCALNHGAFAFYLLVHPSRVSESLEVIRHFHAGPFAVGVGEILPAGHFNGHDFDTDAMIQIAQCAAEHHLPMNFHTGSQESVRQLAQLVDRVPTGRYILAHAAGEAVNEGLDLMDQHENVWMDLSVHAWKPEVRAPLLVRADRSRLLFGSDYPIEQHSTAVAHFREIGFSPEEMRQIAEANVFNVFPKLKRILPSS